MIRRRIENALALDYPQDLLRVVVASDGSTDLTDAIVGEIAAQSPRGGDSLQCPRGQGRRSAPRRRSIRTSARSTERAQRSGSPMLCAPSRGTSPTRKSATCADSSGSRARTAEHGGRVLADTRWVREQESTASSITAGNGAIYAVQREAYVEDDPKFGHDFGFPYLMEQMGRRAVYEPTAVATEKPAAEPEDEYGRKVRTISRALGHILTGRALRAPTRPLYFAQLVSHRVLRYSTGILHLGLLASNLVLVARAPFYRAFLLAQLAGLGLAGAGKARLPVPGARLAYYYFVVTKATVAALVRYLRSGTPQTWEKAKGTR